MSGHRASCDRPVSTRYPWWTQVAADARPTQTWPLPPETLVVQTWTKQLHTLKPVLQTSDPRGSTQRPKK